MIQIFRTLLKQIFLRSFILIVLCLSAPALAQSWTLQTNAFSDYREAVAAVDSFKAQGFDSYSEFFMQNGKQLVRVRIGCFESKDDALAFASLVSSAEKVALPMTENAATLFCTNRSVGFKTPSNWGRYQETPTHIDFWVSLKDVTAYLRFDSSAWRIIQSGSYRPEAATVTGVGYFREEASGLIKLYYPGLSVLTITSGTLIWQNALSAVILENEQLVAYQLSLRP